MKASPPTGASAPSGRTGLSPAISAVILAGGAVVVLFETTSVLAVAGVALIAVGVYGLVRRPRPRSGTAPVPEGAGGAPGRPSEP